MSAILSDENSIKNAPEIPKSQSRKKLFGKEFERMKIPQHMGKLLNYALSDLLLQYSNTLIFGEDVAKKAVSIILQQIYINNLEREEFLIVL